MTTKLAQRFYLCWDNISCFLKKEILRFMVEAHMVMEFPLLKKLERIFEG